MCRESGAVFQASGPPSFTGTRVVANRRANSDMQRGRSVEPSGSTSPRCHPFTAAQSPYTDAVVSEGYHRQYDGAHHSKHGWG